MYSSLGAYPDQVWFDSNRPKLLPYWLDDFTESSRKYNTVMVGNPTGVEGGKTTVVTTNPDGSSGSDDTTDNPNLNLTLVIGVAALMIFMK